MKMYQRGLVATVLAVNAFVAVSAHASEVVTIPWSAALQTSESPNACIPYFPYVFGSIASQCYVAFPLSIPVGRTIQQISVIHSTDNLFPGGGPPFFEAYLQVVTLAPFPGEASQFVWTSSDAVPDGTFERHQLMAQAGKLYLQQFPVAPNTTYQVAVSLANGADIAAVEVIYN